MVAARIKATRMDESRALSWLSLAEANRDAAHQPTVQQTTLRKALLHVHGHGSSCARLQWWEGSVVEAPFLHFHRDRFYLYYSANDYYNSRYAIGYATSDKLEGPYEKPGGPWQDTTDNGAGDVRRTACHPVLTQQGSGLCRVPCIPSNDPDGWHAGILCLTTVHATHGRPISERQRLPVCSAPGDRSWRAEHREGT